MSTAPGPAIKRGPPVGDHVITAVPAAVYYGALTPDGGLVWRQPDEVHVVLVGEANREIVDAKVHPAPRPAESDPYVRRLR